MSEDLDISSRAPRLFVMAPLKAGAEWRPDAAQTNYLVNVLRLGDGAEVLLFNGIDGEWLSHVRLEGKRRLSLHATRRTRPQERAGDVDYLFAPLKSARLDYMAQKATELGARRLTPVLTHRTQVARVNLDRLLANMVEAAEQCGLTWVPELAEPEKLETALSRLEPDRTLVFCDEAAPLADPVVALRTLPRGAALAVLVGPEGGFDEEERDMLLRYPKQVRLSLGPRIMRADTAAIAALSLVQATIGDWVMEPH